MLPDYVNYSSHGQMHSYDQSPNEVGSYEYVLDLFLGALEAFRGPGKLAVLDIGAGTGIYSEHMITQGLEVTALDPSHESLALTTATKIFTTLENSNLQAESFDGIHIKDSLVHIENKISFFKECGRILKPRGVLICVFDEINKSFEWSQRLRGNPVYYATKLKDVARSADLGHIKIYSNEAIRWTPQRTEKDWYKKTTPRIVAMGLRS